MIYKTKVCQRCGKEYQPTSPTQKYCKECGYIAGNEQQARYRKGNLEKVRACDRKCGARYYKANRERHLKRTAKWAKANREKCRKSCTKWQKANPEASVLTCSKRRALKYANTPIDEMLKRTEWLAILAEHNGHCHYCSKKAKLTLDHVIPLSKGGKHSKDNVVPACGHCNSSKGAKTQEQWAASIWIGVAS